MKRFLLASAVLGAISYGGTARAQGMFDFTQPPVGKAAGAFMIRLRAIGVIPLDASSSVSTIGGHVSTTASAAPEIDFSYFLTDNVALELIAATTQHTLSANGTAVGDVKVGSTWVLPPTLMVQYHFMPH
jgi:outer membrane protein